MGARRVVAVLTFLGLLGLGGAAGARGASTPPDAPAPSVLDALDLSTAPPAAPQAVSARIGALVRDLGRSSVLVLDPATDEVLFGRAVDRPRTPASTTKLTTAVAALTTLGPGRRIATIATVEEGTVYLVGGGDATLVRRGGGDPVAGGSASLRDLARQVARTLGPDTTVRVAYDASAFRGARLGPRWPDAFPAQGVVSPVTALMVDHGRVPGSLARAKDPPRQAGQAFADLLAEQGVTVSDVRPGRSPATATEAGRVESATVADLVQRMLTDSDDELAEALGHLVGGEALDQPTFAGGAQATLAALAGLGLDVRDLTLADASGLSRGNRIPVRVLGEILDAVVDGSPAVLGPIAPGLAVAGFTGTLADRYTSTKTRAGRGFVHAKTGTLTGVVGLAGTVQDADGRVLVFAMLDDDVRSIPATRETMDVIASRLAECGCTR